MDGGSFEFISPPGKELLRVVATDKPTEDLAALLNAVFKKQNLTPKEEELKQTIRAKIEARLQSISKQQEQTMAYRGLLTKEAMKEVRAKVDRAGADEIVLRELPNETHSSTFTMVAGTKSDAQPLLVTIPLQSVPEK
jgi:Glu-tRNA(Gln) amidotransferase subunit E-like FAD-binding protein